MASLENSQTVYYKEFQSGVTAVLRSWSALRTAVEKGWGGGERESQKKAEGLRRNIFEILNGEKCPVPNYEIFDLADDLAIYIEEEFSVTLEDDSERQVAETIFQMYEECFNGNSALVKSMIIYRPSILYHFRFKTSGFVSETRVSTCLE